MLYFHDRRLFEVKVRAGLILALDWQLHNAGGI